MNHASAIFSKTNTRPLCLTLLVLTALLLQREARAQTAFSVATIKPSAASVPFERDGKTDLYPNTVRMQDVTVATCLKFAYDIQDSQIAGPDWLGSEHFDILARSDGPATATQMKLMMQSLLADRFKLSFHHEQREMKAFALVVAKDSAKDGAKLREAPADGVSLIQNSGIGFTAKATTMQEFASFIAGPLRAPVVDKTGLPGRYDFGIDFTHFLPSEADGQRIDHTDLTYIVRSAVHELLGLTLEPQKTTVDVFVVDHIDKPSPN